MSAKPHPLVYEWMRLHSATEYAWHTISSGQTVGEWQGHEIRLIAIESLDAVHMMYSAPPITRAGNVFMGTVRHHTFARGEYREATETTLRKLAS